MATRRKQTRGACGYCGREYSKWYMRKHLPTCERRAEVVAEFDQKPGGARSSLAHLRVLDVYGDFWLDLEMQGSATLEELDQYLRAIWLECCGHLSMFCNGGWAEEDEFSMKTRIDRIFQPGVEIVHYYDFGTTSETLVSAVAVREGKPTTAHPIALMARNHPPAFTCMECAQPATHFCVECIYEHDASGTLCRQHTETHPHDDYGEPLSLANSPRTGMCGYDGPAEPPY